MIYSFRFRGKNQRILALYQSFLDHPGQGLHPKELSRMTGIPMLDVVARMDKIPELFVKLPGQRDGLTRYRLTTTATARTVAEIEHLIDQQVRRESWLYYAFIAMVLLVFLIAVMAIAPAI